LVTAIKQACSCAPPAMPVGVLAVEGQDRRYGGRITAFVVLSCMTAGMGGVIFGYDIGIAGARTYHSVTHSHVHTIYMRRVMIKLIIYTSC
jgi:hypothetical protein